MKARYKFIPVLFCLFFFSCKTEKSRFDVNAGDLPVGHIAIKRYGKALFGIDTANLKASLMKLQPEFEIFLGSPEDINDPVNLQRIGAFITDTLLWDVYLDCMTHFPDLESTGDNLYDAFRYFHYYFPEKPIPQVYTYISGFDYQHKVQYVRNDLLIALDMYLGSGYERYMHLGLPEYVLENFQRDYIPSDCMHEIAKSFIDPRQTGNKLLDRMILEGKLRWFVKAMIPGIQDTMLFHYSRGQLEWAKSNEGLVWAFIIENNMLYSTDPMVRQKFLSDNPFTSYFGQKSPPRLGSYIGFHMVNKFMENNPSVTLKQLMEDYNAINILKESRYKPELRH